MGRPKQHGNQPDVSNGDPGFNGILVDVLAINKGNGPWECTAIGVEPLRNKDTGWGSERQVWTAMAFDSVGKRQLVPLNKPSPDQWSVLLHGSHDGKRSLVSDFQKYKVLAEQDVNILTRYRQLAIVVPIGEKPFVIMQIERTTERVSGTTPAGDN